MLFGIFGKQKKKKPLGQPQTLTTRIATILRANIHAALDEAEDPERMMEQFVRDFTANIREAESAIAQTIGNLRLLESEHNETGTAILQWGTKAKAASARADTEQAAGNSAAADRYNRLALTALNRQVSAEKTIARLDPQIQTQNATVAQLKNGLAAMHEKLAELKTKRSELMSRNRIVQAQTALVAAVSSVNLNDPTSEISSFERSIREREALVQGQIEVAANSFDNQFDELENLGADLLVQERLAALKATPTDQPQLRK